MLRVLSPFLGLALAGAGGLVVASVAWQWSGREPTGWSLPPRDGSWADWSWVDRPVPVVGWCLAGGGVLLLVVAARARVSHVPLRDPADGVRVVMTPRALARVVGHRVRAEDGVVGASVTASRRVIRVRATGPASLLPRLLEVARSAVDDLPLPVRPKVSVVVVAPPTDEAASRPHPEEDR